MVSVSDPTKTEANTSITLECPICHSIFQLIHIEPSGMHELLTLVDTCQKTGVDYPLPSLEELQAIKKRVNRWFNEQMRLEERRGDGQ